MTQRMIDAIMQAYAIAKPHLMDELPDRWSVPLMVHFTLGDLRELDRVSGDPDAPEKPRPGPGNADTDLGQGAD